MAKVDQWIVSGASKRGWTTWLVGAAANSCTNCVKIAGMVPFVPIAPDFVKDLHRMW